MSSAEPPCGGWNHEGAKPARRITILSDTASMSGPPSNQRSKRHHYLPESYLSGWADERGQVAVRRRDSPEPFAAVIRKVAVEAGLYDRPGADGQPDDSLERILADFEAPLPELLSLLRLRGAPRRVSGERRNLALLIALQLVRTPEQQDVILFPEDAADYSGEVPVSLEGMRKFLRHEYLGTEPSTSELQGALDFANGALAKGRVPRHEAFELLIEIAIEQVAPTLTEMAWSVEHSPRAQFITCDRPVAVWRRRHDDRAGVGLGSADEVWFPIDRAHLLVLRPRFPEHRVVVDPRRAAQVNRHLAAGCYAMTIAAPGDLMMLGGLQMRARRPALRFVSGPGYTERGDGTLVPTGTRITQLYPPYTDA